MANKRERKRRRGGPRGPIRSSPATNFSPVACRTQRERLDLTVYGVSFAGEGSISKVCGLGGGYSVLNEEMLAFVEEAVAAAP